jgi:hypothetical protein
MTFKLIYGLLSGASIALLFFEAPSGALLTGAPDRPTVGRPVATSSSSARGGGGVIITGGGYRGGK